MAFLHILSVTALAAVATVAGVRGPSDNAATAPGANPTAAELAYADAPYGVDPIVTGPVSKGFETRRQMADCDLARWPDIPLACYPD